MTVELADRRGIDLDAVRRVARERENVRLAPAALARIAETRAAFLRLLEHPDIVIYGVTSDYGDRAGVRLNAEERKAIAQRKPSIAFSFGEPLPERVTRAIVLARLANIVDGTGGVSPAFAEATAALLDGPPLPAVPRLGI
jgi:histidine ammonia-lyase